MVKTFRSTRIQRTAAAALVASLSGIQTAGAQVDDSVTVDLGECVTLDSPEERFACYEAEVDSVLQERGRTATPVDPVEPANEADRAVTSPTHDVGSDTRARRDEDQLGRRERRQSSEQAGVEDEIVSTVVELRETVPNAYLITLENGQVWRQTLPKRYPLRPGQTVRLYSARLSGTRLTAEELNGFIRVERVR